MIDYKSELNDQQFDAVQNGDGPCLVLAGAGSGKTRTITYRVAWLIEHGVPADHILLLTFTNKAASEMIERVDSLLASVYKLKPITYNLSWSGTFHSIANRLLRKYARRIGYGNNFSILDQEDCRELVSLCIKDLKIDTKARKFPKPRNVHDVISFTANKGCSIEKALEIRFPQFIAVKNELEIVADAYKKLKFSQNAMDFDDLLLKLRDLLRNDEEVRTQLSDQFQYVLVDEFQDTNVVQAEIVKLLASKHKNILVVGDDAQSIYSFRAAEIKNILGFPDQYGDTKTFKLTKNYRSTPEILQVANAVIANNPEQFKKELTAVLEKGSIPQLVPASNAFEEANFIADKVRHACSRGVSLSDIAVLFRASFHSQALEFELMKRGIDYEYRGGLKFFERAHIKDVIAHLRLINNIRDITALMRALRIHPGIGIVTAQRIAVQFGAAGSVDHIPSISLKVGSKAEAGVSGFLRVLNKLLGSMRTPADYIRSFTASDEYQNYLENEYQNSKERLDDLEQFAVFAEQEADLNKFLDYVALTQEYGAEKKNILEEDKMILSTVHQAKGLEWHTVFVINMAEGQFPHSRVMDEPNGLEEERRLFYVAATRAKKQLFLTYPVTSGYDSVEYNHPSSFIQEIPREFIEYSKIGPISPRGYIRPIKDSDNWEEPTIIFDSLGERTNKPAPSSFLRDISDL